MPRKFNNVPPDERPNWHRLNEGQRRYAWEQYNLALVRRGLPINHPVPEPEGDFDIDRALENPHPDEHRVAEDLARDLEPSEPSAEEILGNLPDAPEDAVQNIDESHFEGDNQGTHHQRDNAMADSSLTPSRDTNPAKRTRLDFDEAGTSKTSLPGTAKGQGESGNARGEDSARTFRLPKPIVSIQNNVQYFRKVHRFFTYGFAYKVLAAGTDHVMSTPLAMVPWDWLHFYLNPSEFALLPNQSSVKHVKVKVYQRNVRVAFPTNSSLSNIATLNQNKDIVYSVGLNKKLETIPRKYTEFETNQPMIPKTSLPWDIADMQNDSNNWYGSQDNTVGANIVTPRHQTGQPDVLRYYANLIYRDAPTPHDGWECLQTYVEEMDADASSGGLLCEVSYSPKVGICKPPKKLIQRKWTGNQVIPRGSTNLTPHRSTVQMNANGDVAQATSAVQPQDSSFTMLDRSVQILEKSQMFYEGLFHHDSPKVQPSLHVGVQPVYALTSSTTGVNSSFTDTQALFEVVAEAWIDTNSSTFRPLTLESNVKIGNLWKHATGTINYGAGCLDGLYTLS